MPRETIYKSYEPAISPAPGPDEFSYWFVFNPTRLLVTSGSSIPYIKNPGEIQVSPVRTQYLGKLRGHPCFSAEVTQDTAPPEGMAFKELRSLYGVMDEDIFLLAGKAIQIVSWDQNHQYCGKCGHKTDYVHDERAKKCPACGFTSYVRLSPAAITAVIKGDKILLSRNATFRGNMHSLIAGFVEPGETIEECIKREIFEEVGIRVKNIKYFGSQPWPFPNSLMIGFTADYESGEIAVDGKEIIEAAWFDVNHLPELPAKLSIAREIIDWFIQSHSNQI
jgi:NAD+ diphosphatase